MEKVRRLSVFRYDAPLSRPLPGANGILSRQGFLLLAECRDDTTIVSEAAPLPGFSHESSEEAQSELIALIKDLAGNREPTTNSPSVEFAYQSLLRELVGVGTSVDHGGNAVPNKSDKTTIRLNGLLSADGESPARFRDLLARGFATLKVKVGAGTPEDDAVIVGNLLASGREVVLAGGEAYSTTLVSTTETAFSGVPLAQSSSRRNPIRLRLDANRRWTIEEALKFAKTLRSILRSNNVSDSCVEYFEEPVRNPFDLEAFANESGFSVALDESVRDHPDWTTLVDPSFVAAIVVKPTLLGFVRTEANLLVARGLGIPSVISSSFESGVGLYSLVKYAAKEMPDVVAGLATADWFARDVTTPQLRSVSGAYSVVNGGLTDVRLNWDMLDLVHSVDVT